MPRSHSRKTKPEFEKATHKERQRQGRVVNDALRRFVTGQVLAEPTFKELLRVGSRDAIVTAGQFAIEMATKEAKHDVVGASEWIDKARTSFSRLMLHAAGAEMRGPIDHISALALINLAQLPNIAVLLGQRQLPSTEVAERAYKTSVAVNFEMSESLKSRHSVDMIGVVAETSTLLLGQRYAIANHPDRSWFPVRARLSEDHHDWGAHSHDQAWDISVLTDLTGKPEVSYKVQVKASEKAHYENGHSYADDITVVHVHPDLRLPTDWGTASNIAAELHAELHGDQNVSSRLDARTEQLLDVLG